MADLQKFRRGLRGVCPNCGDAKILASMDEVVDHCPSCRYTFVRESGYWLGAMIVLMAFVLLGFFLVFAVGIAATWPDVPWLGIMIVGAVVNLGISFLAYGRAKTAWVGLDLAFNPPGEDEFEGTRQPKAGHDF